VRIFVSYASEDEQQAEDIVLVLRGEQHEVFFDQSQLRGGENYHRVIRDEIDKTELLVFLISPDSVREGGYALTELRFAEQRWPSPSRHVLPVLIKPTDIRSVPSYLKAVTIFEPQGNAAAEVAAHIAGSKPWWVRRGLVVAAAVLIAIAGSIFTLAREQARLVASGEENLNIGRYEDAREAFVHALWLNPWSSRAAWGREITRLKLESADAVSFEKHLHELQQRRPTDPNVQLFLGDLLADREPGEAERHYRAALASAPRFAEAHFRLGVILDRAGRSAEAEEEYRAAIESSGEKPTYRNNLGYLLAKQGNYDEALAEYEKVESGFPLSALETARVLWFKGDLPRAAQFQARAIETLADHDVMALPENREPWYFEAGADGVNVATLREKRCISLLSLAATHCLLERTEEARRHRDAARGACGSSWLDLKDVLAHDLEQLAEVQPHLSERVGACKDLLLSEREAHTGQGPSPTAVRAMLTGWSLHADSNRNSSR
jgi:Flp pilus assembly protein TadD